MQHLYENYLKNELDYNNANKTIEYENLWEKFCVKDKNTPIKTGKEGCFIGFEDENGSLLILRCPSFFECKIKIGLLII